MWPLPLFEPSRCSPSYSCRGCCRRIWRAWPGSEASKARTRWWLAWDRSGRWANHSTSLHWRHLWSCYDNCSHHTTCCFGYDGSRRLSACTNGSRRSSKPMSWSQSYLLYPQSSWPATCSRTERHFLPSRANCYCSFASPPDYLPGSMANPSSPTSWPRRPSHLTSWPSGCAVELQVPCLSPALTAHCSKSSCLPLGSSGRVAAIAGVADQDTATAWCRRSRC